MVYPWFTFPLALGTSALASYGASKLQKRIADRYSSGKMLKRRRNGLLGPSKRMRFSRFSRKRRPRFARGRLRNRIGFRNKFYPRRAFAGSGRFTARKMARAVESKVLAVRNSVANTVTLTNGLVTTTREYLFSPFQSLVQGTGPDQFNGTMIYLKGCLLQFFVTHNTADSYHVQVDCFKEMDDVDRTTFWVQRTDTGDEVTDHFYDRVYGAGSTVTDAENFLAVPNQRGAGPACIFRKRFRSINFNAGGKYGVIMCIYHCLPLLDYTVDLLESSFTKVNATDYAIPEFDRVGMEAVPFAKMMNPPKTSDGANFTPYSSLILGYAPRYIEYKTSVDCSIGGFKDTLKNWVISYSNRSVANQFAITGLEGLTPSVAPMNYTFFKVNPNCLDLLFAVAVNSEISTDNFLCSSFFDIKVVRNLDTDGLPY